jgi:hypothetical protein
MRFIVASAILLLAAAPAAEPSSPKSQCKSRCSVMYGACLKRTTTAKGRAQCKLETKNCKGSCR